jgi:hypothetical protein
VYSGPKNKVGLTPNRWASPWPIYLGIIGRPTGSLTNKSMGSLYLKSLVVFGPEIP